jgi:FemAB-related protein (PEP-CTERM system-associated)
MNISIAEDKNLRDWDDYVNSHPDGCVFHTFAWRKAIELAYGHQPLYLMAQRGSQIHGVLPMFLIKSRIFGRVLASCPYASFGGICADDQESAHALVERAVQLAREVHATYLEIKSTRMTNNEHLERHTDYINYDLPLEHPDILWVKRLKGRARTALRKADEFKLTCSEESQRIDSFYNLMALSMRRLGTPVHSRSFYQAILSLFGTKAAIFTAKYQEIPIATLLQLRHRDEVAVLCASSLAEYWHMNPNNYLYWEAIKAAYQSGASRFDFGRSLEGSGPTKFKESWGASAKRLYYEYFLSRCKSIPRIHQDNPHYKLATSMWKRLPLNITKVIGPYLINKIP